MNHFYLENPCLWADDDSWNGYQWVQPDDRDNSVFAWRRIDPKTKKELLVILNATPVARDNYRMGVPKQGVYEPVFCSDDWKYGGTGSLPRETIAEKLPFREYQYSANFHIAPMSLTIFQRKTAKKATE